MRRNPLGALLICAGVTLAIGSAHAQRPTFAELETRVAQLEAAAAQSSDGRHEIDQDCAVNTGCFTGDTAGFPVTITTPGSYRLGSDLITPNLTVNAIEVTATSASIDLAGFEIAGPGGCTGTGGTISCTFGLGSGIWTSTSILQVTNGRIRDFGTRGVYTTFGGTLRDLEVHGCALDGITTFGPTVVQRVNASRNGQEGIYVHEGSTVSDSTSDGNGGHGIQVINAGVVARSTATRNGGNGFEASQVAIADCSSSNNDGAGYSIGSNSRFSRNISRDNALEDDCGGGVCSEKPRYYHTSSTYDSTDALTACDSGFRIAYIHEVANGFSGHRYDPRASASSGPSRGSCSWYFSGSGSTAYQAHFNSVQYSNQYINCNILTGPDRVRCDEVDLKNSTIGHDKFMYANSSDCTDPTVGAWCVEER